jgi:hypothetical protein
MANVDSKRKKELTKSGAEIRVIVLNVLVAGLIIAWYFGIVQEPERDIIILATAAIYFILLIVWRRRYDAWRKNHPTTVNRETNPT